MNYSDSYFVNIRRDNEKQQRIAWKIDHLLKKERLSEVANIICKLRWYCRVQDLDPELKNSVIVAIHILKEWMWTVNLRSNNPNKWIVRP